MSASGTIVTLPPGWTSDRAAGGFVRDVRPFGRLVVRGHGSPVQWEAHWHFNDEMAWLVGGPFEDPDEAFDAAIRWLFNSWSAIEAQLEPAAPYRRDPVLDLILGSFIALLVGVLLGIAVAEWF